LLAHVDGRTAEKVAAWLAEQPSSWRAGVTHACIDLSASYAKAVAEALPDAVLVADRFHLVRLANDMVTEVRQHATRKARDRRGRKTDPEWANRRRLLTAHERLRPASFTRMWNALIDAGDLGIDILHAYTVKENLRQLLALAPTPGTSVPNRSEISHRLWRFHAQAAACDLPEAHRLAETIDTWWPAIEAALTTGYSNARSEGYNRLAKHQGRSAFGFRNVDHQLRVTPFSGHPDRQVRPDREGCPSWVPRGRVTPRSTGRRRPGGDPRRPDPRRCTPVRDRLTRRPADPSGKPARPAATHGRTVSRRDLPHLLLTTC
jgi:transposase